VIDRLLLESGGVRHSQLAGCMEAPDIVDTPIEHSRNCEKIIGWFATATEWNNCFRYQ